MVTVYMTAGDTQQVAVWAQARGGRGAMLLNFWTCQAILHSALYILHLSFWLCCTTLPRGSSSLMQADFKQAKREGSRAVLAQQRAHIIKA